MMIKTMEMVMFCHTYHHHLRILLHNSLDGFQKYKSH